MFLTANLNFPLIYYTLQHIFKNSRRALIDPKMSQLYSEIFLAFKKKGKTFKIARKANIIRLKYLTNFGWIHLD